MKARRGGAYGLVGLFAVLLVAVAILPWVRRTFARSFPEGFRDQDCKGVICREGQFCQENVCRDVGAPNTGGVASEPDYR
jgi:hypothetical protein